VTVQAGITMTELIDWANANDLTLPLGTVPSYLDLTIGGLLATGGHAQGPKRRQQRGEATVRVHQTSSRGGGPRRA
jgi:FAD/FMN-containing dehydrogenase